jgi:hypothetical protein
MRTGSRRKLPKNLFQKKFEKALYRLKASPYNPATGYEDLANTKRWRPNKKSG